ncbi:MAG: hypothetical protein QOI41_6622 [Myxococcales bacterium]|nr:hypothetical protein [Myxococcales bacterium]
MIDVKELLRRWAARHSNRKMARETGTDRDTAGRYIAVAEQLAVPRDRTLSEAEIHEVAPRVQARPMPDPSAGRKTIADHEQPIIDWLGKKRPLRLSKIHTLLVRDHGSSRAATRCAATRWRSSAGRRKSRRSSSKIRRRARRRGSTSARWG